MIVKVLTALFTILTFFGFSQITSYYDARLNLIQRINSDEDDSIDKATYLNMDSSLYNGVVLKYVNSTLMESICVNNGKWTGFKQYVYKDSRFTDSVFMISYKVPDENVIFTWSVKKFRGHAKKQISSIEIRNEKSLTYLGIKNRHGKIILNITEWFEGKKILKNKIVFKEKSKLVEYLSLRDSTFKFHSSFLDSIGFFNMYFVPIPIGCLE